MMIVIALTVFVTVTAGLYLALSRDVFRCVIGLAMLGAAANLVLFAAGPVVGFATPERPSPGERRSLSDQDCGDPDGGDGRITLAELDSLHDQTSITHLIVSRLGPIETEPVYQNGTYRVYQLGP